MRKWNVTTEKKSGQMQAGPASGRDNQPGGNGYNAANAKPLGKGGSRYQGGGYYEEKKDAAAEGVAENLPPDGQPGKGYGAFGGFQPRSDPEQHQDAQSGQERRGQSGERLREDDSENENRG